jgi:hypothetical protein
MIKQLVATLIVLATFQASATDWATVTLHEFGFSSDGRYFAYAKEVTYEHSSAELTIVDTQSSKTTFINHRSESSYDVASREFSAISKRYNITLRSVKGYQVAFYHPSSSQGDDRIVVKFRVDAREYKLNVQLNSEQSKRCEPQNLMRFQILLNERRIRAEKNQICKNGFGLEKILRYKSTLVFFFEFNDGSTDHGRLVATARI